METNNKMNVDVLYQMYISQQDTIALLQTKIQELEMKVDELYKKKEENVPLLSSSSSHGSISKTNKTIVKKTSGVIDVIVVEDVSVSARLAYAALKMGHFKVEVAVDGLAAIELFRRHSGGSSLKAILMDIQLPGMSGTETTREIRRIEREMKSVKPVWIYGLTSNVSSEDVMTYKACGLNGCILKGKLLAETLRKSIEESENGVEFVNFYDYTTIDLLPSSSSSSSAPSSSFSPPNMLLVEDVRVSQKIALHALQRAGYNVIVADTGEVAVEKYKQHVKSLLYIIMDINLPGMSGMEATKQIRSLEKQQQEQETEHVYIFGLTGNVDQDNLRSYEAHGMDGCILKGKSLPDAINKAIEGCKHGHFSNITSS